MQKLCFALILNFLWCSICYSANPVWDEVVGVEGLRVLANDTQMQQFLQLTERQVISFKQLWRAIATGAAPAKAILDLDEKADRGEKVSEQVQKVLTKEQTQKLAWRYLRTRLENTSVSAIFYDESFLRGVGITPMEQSKIAELLRLQSSKMSSLRVEQFKELVTQLNADQRARAQMLLGDDWVPSTKPPASGKIPLPPVLASLDSYDTAFTLTISPHQKEALKLTSVQLKQIESWIQAVRDYDSSVQTQENRRSSEDVFEEIAGPLPMRSLLSEEQLQKLTQSFARGLVQSGGLVKLLSVAAYERYLEVNQDQKRAFYELVAKHNQIFDTELEKLEKDTTAEILAMLNRESVTAIKRYLGDDLSAELARHIAAGE